MANPPANQKKAAPAKAPTDPAVVKAQQEADLKALQAMNPILAVWEKRSAQVTSLDAVFDKIVRDKGFGDEWYRGRAMLQSPDKACLEFKKYKLDKDNKPIVQVDANGKKTAVLEKDPDTRTVCTGVEVLLYSWGSRSVTVYPLNKKAQQRALQEGPLPFLFNMKAAEAKQRYSMRLLKENEKQYLIGIVPLQEIDQSAFAQAFLWLNKTTFLPDMLWLLPVGGKNQEEFIFSGSNDKVMANLEMDPKFFKFQTFVGWKTVINKGDAGNPAAPGPVQAQPKQQANQPAARAQPH
jgi:TIGR03009 family protein